MAPTIVQVMQGIEARLETISGLRVSHVVPDQVNPPQAIVGVPPIPRYHQSMQRGKFDLEPTVTVLVSAGLDRAGQQNLAAYADPTGDKSIIVAIEGDRTLGSVVDDCIVISFEPLGLQEVGLIGYYGGRFALRAIASGV